MSDIPINFALTKARTRLVSRALADLLSGLILSPYLISTTCGVGAPRWRVGSQQTANCIEWAMRDIIFILVSLLVAVIAVASGTLLDLSFASR